MFFIFDIYIVHYSHSLSCVCVCLSVSVSLQVSMVITNKEKNILKDAMSKAKLYQKKEITEGKEIMPIMNTVRLFLKQKRVLCYGGTAINAALNPEDKFYDAELDIPDYDFFSTNALNDAKQLADIFAKTNKYTIEAKSGQHYGTYKVFVNFIPVADITQCDPFIFERLWEEKLIKQGINYVPPNFLRWSMYLELSRPMGDTSRWEKVYERLDLLNKQYPLPKNACSNPKIKRDQYELHKDLSFLLHLDNSDKLFLDLKRILVKENVIFFGYNAFSEYVSAAKGVDSNIRKNIKNDVIDFEVISLDAAASASTIHRQLIKLGYKNVAVKDSTNPAISDYIEKCYEIVMNDIVLVHIYQSMACHSYHSIQDKKLRMQIKIASIETLFSFYFIFLYLNDHYVRSYRILCVAHTLMMIQAKHKYETNGLLKRFPICVLYTSDAADE